MRDRFMMQLPHVDPTGKWNGDWGIPVAEHVSSTLTSLRQPSRYYVVSDAQLARDLRPRTLADVYRENRLAQGRVEEKYRPRQHDKHVTWIERDHSVQGYTPSKGGLGVNPVRLRIGGSACNVQLSIEDEYITWCKSRGHVPHPASLDPNHPVAKQREGLRHCQTAELKRGAAEHAKSFKSKRRHK